MNDTVYGPKYDGSLSTPAIAKLVRTEIAAAIKSGDLPKIKTSVRSESFAGGSAIRIAVKEVPAGFVMYNPEWLAREIANPHGLNTPAYGESKYSPAYDKMMATLKSMLDAYNFDGSDTQTDYFHVNFYGSVDFDWKLGNALRAAEVEALKAAKAPKKVCIHGGCKETCKVSHVKAPKVGSKEEWEALYEALGQYVENEVARDDVEDPFENNPKLAAAEAMMLAMDAQLQALA